METPKKVIDAAADMIEDYGQRLRHIGQYDGKEAFLFSFPEDREIGYPIVYLYKDGEVETILEDETIKILVSLGVE